MLFRMPSPFAFRLSHPLAPVAAILALSCGVALLGAHTSMVLAWVVVGMSAGYSISGSI